MNYKKGIANVYGNLGNIYEAEGDYPNALKYQSMALALDKEINLKESMASDYSNLGLVYSDQGNYAAALSNYMLALDIDKEMGSKQNLGYDYGNIGVIYYSQGNYPQALDNYLLSLKLEEAVGDKLGIGSAYGNIGNIYEALHDYPNALKNQLASLKVKEEIGNKEGMASSYGNIGNIYADEGSYAEALKNQLLSLKIDEEIGNKQGSSTAYVNIGEVNENMHDYREALKNLFKALAISRELGDKGGICFVYNGLASAFIKEKKYEVARLYVDSVFMNAKPIGNKDMMRFGYMHLTDIDSATGNFKAAFEDHKKYIWYRDSLENEETTKKTTSEQMQYDFDKKQLAEKAEQDRKDAIHNEELQEQKIVIYVVSAGLILVLLLAGIIFRSLRQSRRKTKIIAEQKAEVDKKNVLIEQQKGIVEEKNKEILDSIAYAKRLQDAILPPIKEIKKHLPESFVLYKPKDIVAGDFYWMWSERTSRHALSGENSNDIILLAACDCTGHGVPGAMVSVVCSNALNRAVKEFHITEPGKILDKVRELVLETFEKSTENVQDGMDISLCSISRLSVEEGPGVKLQWAGAYNPLWIIHSGKEEEQHEVKEIAPNKQPIGKTDNAKPFTTHKVNLAKGDVLYLFTDGYADQFGGDKGKKFKASQLKEKLLSIVNEKMDKQEQLLNEILETWKGSLEQVDDILILGIRV